MVTSYHYLHIDFLHKLDMENTSSKIIREEH